MIELFLGVLAIVIYIIFRLFGVENPKDSTIKEIENIRSLMKNK